VVVLGGCGKKFQTVTDAKLVGEMRKCRDAFIVPQADGRTKEPWSERIKLEKHHRRMVYKSHSKKVTPNVEGSKHNQKLPWGLGPLVLGREDSLLVNRTKEAVGAKKNGVGKKKSL